MSYEVTSDYEGHDNYDDAYEAFLEILTDQREGEIYGTDKEDLAVIFTCVVTIPNPDGSYAHQTTPEWLRIKEQLSKVEQLETEIKDVRRNKDLIKDAYDKLLYQHQSLLSRLPKNADGIKANQIIGNLKPLEWAKLHENHFVAGTFGGTEIEIWLDESLDEPEWHWGWVTPRTEDNFPSTASSLDEAKALASDWHRKHVAELFSSAESCQSAQTEGEGA